MDERKLGDVIDIPESFGKEPAETPQAEAPAVAQPEASDTPRDDKGRFAPKVEAAATEQPKPQETTGAPPAAVPPAATNVQPEPGHVPIAALLDTRDKLAEQRRANAELQARLAQFERQKAEPPPDFFADPEAAFSQRLQPIQQQFQDTVSTLNFRASKAEAIATHGKKVVDDAIAFLNKSRESNDPELSQLGAQMDRSLDPVGVAIDWVNRKKVLSEVGSDPAAYREKIIAEYLASQQKPAGTPAQAAPVTPPSMAAVANGGAPSRDVELTPKGKFEEMFNR